MSAAPVVSSRKTHFVVDAEDFVILEPAFGYTRELHHMAAGAAQNRSNVHFLEGFGWSLSPVHEGTDAFIFERESVQDSFLDSSQITIPSGWEEVYRSRRISENTGAYTGANADYIASQGGLFFRKKKPQDLDWDDSSFSLEADEAAFPKPDDGTETGKLDRVAVTPDLHNPIRPVELAVELPGAGRNFSGPVATLYFSGPAGWDQVCKGYGQYAARIDGDGSFTLFERGAMEPSGTVGWARRNTWRMPTAIGGHSFFTLKVYPFPFKTKKHPNGCIVFDFAVPGAGFPLTESMISTAISIAGGSQVVYDVPKTDWGVADLPIHPCAIRVDMRRDQRPMFAVLQGKYKESGYFLDTPFTIGCYPTLSVEISVRVFGRIPDGCTMKGKLYLGKSPADLTECTLVREASYGTDGWERVYTIPVPADLNDPPNTFFVGVYFTGDSANTPLLSNYDVIRAGLVQKRTPTEIDCLVARAPRKLPESPLTSVSITGAGSDASHEQATVRIQDVTNRLGSVLGLRGGMCVRLETEYDAGDPSKRCVLARGYVQTALALKRGRKGSAYPSASWREYDVSFAGVWARLETIYPPSAFNWAQDPATGGKEPYKVTDLIQAALSWAGFPSDDPAFTEAEWMCDIGTGTNCDEEVRLWPSGQNDQMMISPTASIAELLRTLAYDYFGAAIYFDANLGTYGKWILIFPTQAPYTIRANFLSSDNDPDVIAPGDLRHVLEGYADKEIGDTDTTVAGTVPSCPIWRDSLQSHPIPPEFNLLEITGWGQLPIVGLPVKMTNVLVNTKSFDFYGEETGDPTDPDFLGYIKQVLVADPLAASPEAIAFAARRLYDLGAHAYKLVKFSAPLLLIDHPDEEGRKRPLRWGDPILIDGEVFIVDSVCIGYEQDIVQHMTVEAFSPRF